MENKEIWKDIPNYQGLYQVSNLGRVKSLERKAKQSRGGYRVVKERVLKGGLGGRRYMAVNLYKNGVKKTRQVHQLVAMAFLGHKPNGMKLVVNHIDNNRANNKADNLELVSNRYNTSVDKWRYNTASKYVGVSLYICYKDGSTRWRALIEVNGKRKHLGYFRDEEDAAAAYQSALKQIS